MKIVFLGAPGAGKGTQAEKVSEELNIPNISTGELLRAAIKDGTETGKKAKEYMDKGALVPDDIVIAVLKERLAEPNYDNGFILDGFPRNVAQAEYLEKIGVIIDLVVNIHVPDEKIIERMGGRRICPSCGASYHMVYRPSHRGDTCGRCENRLIIRDDDKPEVVLKRLETYHRDAEPLKEFYNKKGILKSIRGQQERVEDTTKQTLELIESFKN